MFILIFVIIPLLVEEGFPVKLPVANSDCIVVALSPVLETPIEPEEVLKLRVVSLALAA